MSDDFTVALRFESEGIPKTVGDVRRITAAVEDVKKQNELAAKSAQILGEAYELTEKEVRQVQRALSQAAKEQQRDARAAAKEVERFQAAFERAAKAQERAAQQAAAEAQRAREQFEATAAVVSTGLAVGIGAFFNQSIEQFRQFEQFESILTNALGSPEAAQEALALIEQFAATTPFQLDEVVESFIKLQNRGISPTTEQLTQLGDVAASQGKSLDQITEAILDAQTGEFERLKEFGIQASASGDQVAIAFRDANLEVERTPEAIADAIFSLGDLEGVAGGMAAQAETLTGRLSNLGDETAKAGVAFGEFANAGVRPVVDGAILLVQSFNSLPAPIQATVIASTALTGALAAAVAAITAYNLANGQRIVQEGLAAAATIRNTAAVAAQGAALQVSAAAQATYATLTGQATAAQIAQTRAIAAGAVTLAAVAGAAASVALAADTFNAVTAAARETDKATKDVRESLQELDGELSSEEEASRNFEKTNDELNIFQRTLDNLIRGPLPGVATAAEASANRSQVAFSELLFAVSDVEDQALKAAEQLEQGLTVDPGAVQGTVASIDSAIDALERQEPVTAREIELRDEQIERLQAYRERIVSTNEALGALGESTDDLANRLESLNNTLDSGQLAVQQAGQAALAALEEQRAAGAISADDYQAQLVSIERAGFDDRIALAQEKLAELRELERTTEDEDTLAGIQEEILRTQLVIDRDRIASAQSRTAELVRQEREAEQASKEAAEAEKQRIQEVRDAAIKAAQDEADALKEARETQSEAAQEEFDASAQREEDRFSEQMRTAERRFNNQQRSEQEAFEDSQRSEGRRFQNQQQSDQEAFNDRQRSEEEAFQNRINEARREGSANFDALESEVDRRIELANAGTKAERDAIKDRQEAELEAAEQRRQIEEDVLRQQRSVLSDADTDLSPLEQARADFEAGLQAQEAEFEAGQREEAQAFEDSQQLAKQEFQDGQRLAQREFENEQRQLEDAFNDQQRGLENTFNRQQEAAEASFKASQRQLDEASARTIANLLENARSNVTARRDGGPVRAGQPYLVGEEGPELIFPSRGGFVATAGQTARMLSAVGVGGDRFAPAVGVSTSKIEEKLDRLIKVTARQNAGGNNRTTINLGQGATQQDAMSAALDYQRAKVRGAGL